MRAMSTRSATTLIRMCVRALVFCGLCVCLITVNAMAKQPPILLANVLGPNIDVSQYLVSEKYDGVRAIWDGHVLRFRSGREVPAPAWFIAQLPANPLDGELWLARRKFDELSGIVRKTVPLDDEWRRVNYMIFETPDADGTLGTFEQRYARIRDVVAAAQWPQLRAVEQTRVANRAQLRPLRGRYHIADARITLLECAERAVSIRQLKNHVINAPPFIVQRCCFSHDA